MTAFRLEIDGCDASFGELTLIHPLLNQKLRVVTLSGMNGLFTRRLFLTNMDDRPVSLTRVSPLSGVLWEMAGDTKDYMDDFSAVPFRVGGFRERYWGTEGHFDWLDVPYNSAVDFGSDTGRSGHGHPFAIAHSEFLGGYFLCQMAWSASWRFRFDNEYRHIAGSRGDCLRLCFELAPTASAPMCVIDPGEELAMPEVHFAFSYENLDGVIQKLHAYQRKYLLAKPEGDHELISYDGWGYHGSDYKDEILFAEVDRAAELGAELYMVDAGWYGRPGTSWKKTVGDWQTSRLKNDLYSFHHPSFETVEGVIFKIKRLKMPIALFCTQFSFKIKRHQIRLHDKTAEALCRFITQPPHA